MLFGVSVSFGCWDRVCRVKGLGFVGLVGFRV